MMLTQAARLGQEAVDQDILKRVNELLEEIDFYLWELRTLSNPEADRLGAMVDTCRQHGFTAEGVACLEELLAEVKRVAGPSELPAWFFVLGGAVAVGALGGLVYLFTVE